MSRLKSPDCRDGKHGSCIGVGWDSSADVATECPCPCHLGDQWQVS